MNISRVFAVLALTSLALVACAGGSSNAPTLTRPISLAAPQPSASAASGNLGDISFALINYSGTPVYHSIYTYCYSGVDHALWSQYPIAAGQSLAYEIGNVGSGSCFGQTSTGTTTIQGAAVPDAKRLFVSFQNQLTPATGQLTLSTSGASPCMSIYNPNNESSSVSRLPFLPPALLHVEAAYPVGSGTALAVNRYGASPISRICGVIRNTTS
jgi:hypothetical protein